MMKADGQQWQTQHMHVLDGTQISRASYLGSHMEYKTIIKEYNYGYLNMSRML
jgi:hypothetical protein